MDKQKKLMMLAFEPGQLIRFLSRAAGTLVICHLIGLALGNPSWQLERLFGLGYDNNIPTWFSSLLWALPALVAYRLSRFSMPLREKNMWLLIAAGFLVFSIDEVAMIHESIFATIGKVLPANVQQKIISEFSATNWPVFGAPFLLLGLLWAVSTFRHLLKGSPRAAGLIFWGIFTVIAGGAGLEMSTNFFNHDSLQWVWEMENVFEESLEMAGAILILAGLLCHEQVLAGRQVQPQQTQSSKQEKEAILCRA